MLSDVHKGQTTTTSRPVLLLVRYN